MILFAFWTRTNIMCKNNAHMSHGDIYTQPQNPVKIMSTSMAFKPLALMKNITPLEIQ